MTVPSGYEQTDDKYYLNRLVRKLQAEHGTIEITEDGTYDVGQYDTAEVSVGGGGGQDSALRVLYKVDAETGDYRINPTYETIIEAWEAGRLIYLVELLGYQEGHLIIRPLCSIVPSDQDSSKYDFWFGFATSYAEVIIDPYAWYDPDLHLPDLT